MLEINTFLSLPSYRMAVINGLFWFLYCFLFYVFCLRKPKLKINYLLWLLILSLLPIVSIFRQGTYESGDLSLHATRLMAFWESISQGEIIPRWASSLNGGFGYPLFQFIYPLPYYLASFWHWVGFGFINSIKITITLAYILSGWVFYLLAKKHVSDWAAFAGAVLYLFAPYHLVDLHFRVAFGEVVGFLFLPLTMLCGKNYIDSGLHRSDSGRKTKLWFELGGLSFAGLILSHQAIALISPIILIPYWWLVGNKISRVKRVFVVFRPLLLGLTLSAFYWLPVLLESKFVLAKSFALGVEFENIVEYLYSPWRLGLLFQGPNGELSFIIGYVQVGLVLVAGWQLVKGKLGKQKPLVALFGVLLLVNCYLLLPSSKFVWDNIPILRNFHYTYRLLLPISLIVAMIGAMVSETLIKRPKVIYVLIFLTVFSTILNWGNRRNIPQIDDNYLKIDLPYATVRGEGLDAGATRWSDINNLWQKEPTQKLIQTNKDIVGYETITNVNRQKALTMITNQPTLVKYNQLYFPGWMVTVNGETKPILYEQKEHYGMITFHVPEGESEVRLEFRDTGVRKIAGVISLVGLVFCVWKLGRFGKLG